MSTPHKISVIIPCYNSEKYLRQTIQSVLWQTYPHWECIMVDDGSTDSSAEIYQSFMPNDSRFIYSKQKNQGPSIARNFGVLLAKGEFIQFLDADDILLPNRFQECISAFEHHKEIDIVYSDFVLYQFGQKDMLSLSAKISGNDIVKAMLFDLNVGFVVLIHSMLFRYAIVKDHPFDISLPFWAEDQDCWIRMAIDGAKYQYIENVLVVYRFSENNLTSKETKLIASKIIMLERYQSDIRTNHYTAEFQSSILYLQQRLAMGYFMEKSFREGIRLMSLLWRKSSVKSKIKMIGWGILMIFFSKKYVERSRVWIIKHTPFKWGGWKDAKIWNAPESLLQLLKIE